ncbi:putative proline iminopeptidase [Streptomyces sp. NBRC 110611]|uniref:alpha/beta fold hydrolase n=1 Tax=Streptomyces sp. NBRC 110611 TaxID=1621259 RepID=UPI000833CEC3|nr:alpha/beta fold hydrolase [Streptomyces sp. NBRC 110611]GAU68434.1 putative proline iminopeptidase [Streptomyces sp. NBRC 110611]
MAVDRLPGVVLTDHVLEVPLDHDDPGGERLTVYGREAVAAGREDEELPWLLFLQGGPGFPSPRPVGQESWLKRALEDHRVLLLDQRGTGRSTPANRQTLPLRGGPERQAAYLAHFRADSIVRDAELFRRRLVPDGGPWSVLGQSFGGFCTVSYLSHAPEGLSAAYVTGGLPGLTATAEDVYRAAYPRVARKNAAHYARYPQDVAAVRRIAEHLREHTVRLPGGGLLTAEAFQALGLMLGSGAGSHTLHHLVAEAWVTGAAGPEPADTFLHSVQDHLSHAAAPLFAVLHESLYGQRSVDPGPTGWAAQRLRSEFAAFDVDVALAGDGPVYFTGEMMYPWLFDTDPALRPLKETAQALAERTDWPDLYDAGRLAANEVPAAAAVYFDDMYVDTAHALRTAETIRGLRVWVTNEWEHDGLRVSDGAVLHRLMRMVRGEI